jgi:hypothetical protein
MVEELKAIVNKLDFSSHIFEHFAHTDILRHGTTLTSGVWGKIETNVKLSGNFITVIYVVRSSYSKVLRTVCSHLRTPTSSLNVLSTPAFGKHCTF